MHEAEQTHHRFAIRPSNKIGRLTLVHKQQADEARQQIPYTRPVGLLRNRLEPRCNYLRSS